MDSLIRILVGPAQREFVVHRALLCASSPFFRDSIDAVPEGLSSLSSSPSSSPPSSRTPPPASPAQHTPTIWLASESADVFELFVLWLYRRHAFRSVVDDAVSILAKDAGADAEAAIELRAHDADKDAEPSVSANLSELHWHLVNLHLFAALVDIPALQDVVMDSLQDLYLRFDWAATPSLIRFLYAEADPFAAFRLRKWAVPLLAWTLANAGAISGPSPADSMRPDAFVAELLRLLQTPTLSADYHAHIAKMQASRADVRIKNPQLRIASNLLRREDRHFGFRQCSFHSHRRAVREGRCPHTRRVKTSHDIPSKNTIFLSPTTSSSPSSTPSPPPSSHRDRSPMAMSSEPRRAGMAVRSPLPAMASGYAPLGMESTR